MYAPLGRRFMGFVIDSLLIGVLSLLMLPLFDVNLDDLDNVELPAGWQVGYLVMLGVYQIGFIIWRGQTPGKIALRMKVADETTDAIPGLGAATVRWLIPAAAATVPLVGVVALGVIYGAVLFDRRRQGIHDRAARTVVIDLRVLPPPPAEASQEKA